MAWHFKDSQGIKGPLTETQIRELLNSGNFDTSAMVRQGDSSWVAAETVRTKFAQLEKEGIYLRSDDKIFGPFVARRADELKSQNPDQFDSYKIGKNGKWLTVETLRKPESGTPERSRPAPPPKANTPTNASPISAKEAFAPLVSLAKQTASRIANNPRVQEVFEKGKEQFQNKTTNASSSPPAIPLPKPIEKKKTSSQKMVALGCGGCLLAPCLLTVVVMIFGLILGPSVTISGTTGTITKTLGAGFLSIEGAAALILVDVHDVAIRNKELEKIVVNIKMSSIGVKDKYGNEVENDIEMGSITISNLDEVRKYSNDALYAYSIHSSVVQAQLRRMKGASLLQ